MWVADFNWGKAFAYRLGWCCERSGVQPDRHSSINPFGLWSNGWRPTGRRTARCWPTTCRTVRGKAFAYRLSDGARVSDREFNLTGKNGSSINPFGLWSNGETGLLASNWQENSEVLAYNLSDGEASTDIDTRASGATRLSGIWPDGETLWVVDDLDRRVYAYAVPGLGRGP